MCSRCRPGTYKLRVGGYVSACTPCEQDLIDHDNDPVTPCVEPLEFKVISFTRDASLTHLLKGKPMNKYAIDTTYQFAKIGQIKTDGITDEEKDTISYTLLNAPPGFLIDTKTVRSM